MLSDFKIGTSVIWDQHRLLQFSVNKILENRR